MSEVKVIRIDIKPGIGKYLRSLFSIVFGVVFPVSIGVYTGSTAMQWVGLAFGILAVFGWAANSVKQTTFNSFDDAIAYLEKEKRS